jgi:hypothetical protein
VTIQIPDGGLPFNAELVKSSRCSGCTRRTAAVGAWGVRGLLSAALQNGWRIVRASPEEQAMLDAHGFGSRRIQ